jgi:hypothetical protein
MKLDYLLTGVIAGSYIEITGKGEIDQALGSFSLELEAVKAPAGWDPGVIIMICCDNLRLFSAKQKNDSTISAVRTGLRSLQFGSFVNSHRQGTIVDSLGNPVVHMKAKGFLFIEGGVAKSRTVILDGFSNLDKHGGIEKITTPYYEKITPTGPNTAEGLSTYQLLCADGTVLTGHTNYPYVFNDGPALNAESTLEVHVAESNSQDFINAGVSPKLNVSIREV